LSEIALGFPAPEQELEQIAEMGRERLLPARMGSGFEVAKKSDDLVRGDRAQVAKLVAESKDQEPLHESRSVVDGGLGQSSLLAQVALVLVTQAIEWS
jgi:hypothetical protein